MSDSHFDQAAAGWDEQPHRVRMIRAVGEAIIGRVPLTAEMSVLDYGCGTGLLGLYLLPRVANVTGADSSAGMLEHLGRKIAAGGLENMRAVRLNLETDPPLADRFDVIVCNMAMHHIADTARTLRGFHEMLRPGGFVCISDLDTEPGTFHSPASPVAHRGFDREAFKARLVACGFADAGDTTAIAFSRPVEAGGEQQFSIFLLTARRPTDAG